ncbi:Putative uncharacterized protein [Moritella viscosa]|uniref:Uncharacterized protein n=1 Tax=Moritella viscosa TaxID=80854 RepID=A0ABY1HG93_9GAMM|nr:Putative uncharacterized protein [Moritella viscosa]
MYYFLLLCLKNILIIKPLLMSRLSYGETSTDDINLAG